jgi:hypothetical protein
LRAELPRVSVAPSPPGRGSDFHSVLLKLWLCDDVNAPSPRRHVPAGDTRFIVGHVRYLCRLLLPSGRPFDASLRGRAPDAASMRGVGNSERTRSISHVAAGSSPRLP